MYENKKNLQPSATERSIVQKNDYESEIVRKQEQILKVIAREKTLIEIMSFSVNTLEIKEIIKSIITKAGKLFKADRCFFVEYDMESNKNYHLRDYEEYLSSTNIRSHLTRPATEDDVAAFIKITKQKKASFVEDVSKFDLPESSRKMLVDDLSVKSYATIPVFHGDIMYGTLVLHYVNDFMQFTKDDIEVAQAIANQSAVVFHHAKLYQKLQAQANREKLLREIVSSISSTLDFNEIRQMLVSKLGCALNSDISILYIRDTKNKKFMPVDEYSLHLSSNEMLSPLGLNIIEDYGWANYIKNNKKSDIAYADIEDLKNDYKLHGTKAEDFLNMYNIKSMLAIPIIHAGTFLGFLVLNFVKERKNFTNEDINLAKIVANQAGITLYQSKLYIEAQAASQTKSEFIANMSHEIRTPLNIIIGFSELLSKSEIEPKKQIKYLQNINDSGKHLLNLTNDIISVSKIESGTFKLNYEKIDTKALIMDVISSIKLISGSKEINTDLTEANIIADKKILTQILYNLLNNAIKFTSDTGRISVKSEIEKNKLIVSIKDDGIGIDSKDLNKIFDKFKQIDSSVNRQQQGAGLGLTITKKLVELLDGVIQVESIKGKGSHFWFILPKAEKKAKC